MGGFGHPDVKLSLRASGATKQREDLQIFKEVATYFDHCFIFFAPFFPSCCLSFDNHDSGNKTLA